jgi:hypothetical protein
MEQTIGIFGIELWNLLYILSKSRDLERVLSLNVNDAKVISKGAVD